MSQTILVTGAGGFVGGHLIAELRAQGRGDIYATVYKSTRDISTLLQSDHIIAGDLRSSQFTDDLIKKTTPSIIYHLASLSVVEGSDLQGERILADNQLLQHNLLESVRLHSSQSRVIAVCSANEYGRVKAGDIPIDEDTPLNPLNPYAKSKVEQDKLAHEYYHKYGLDIIRLRPFNHTGSGQTTQFVIPALAKQFAAVVKGKQKAMIEVGNLDSIRDFTAVEDMVKAYILAADKCVGGEVYNIGTGEGVTVARIIQEFESITGIKVKTTSIPSKTRVLDVPILIADATKFRTLTGWCPKISLRQTLENVYNDWKEKMS